MAAAGRKMGHCKPHQPAPWWMLELPSGHWLVGNGRRGSWLLEGRRWAWAGAVDGRGWQRSGATRDAGTWPRDVRPPWASQDGQSRTVRQFQFTDWPEQGVPKSGEGFIDFIGQVHKTKEQFGQDGPISVHCR